jgi:autophagy-related protein 18
MYESSRLVALVGAGEQPAFSPRRLTIWNLTERTAICETAFSDTILNVQMNRLRIVAATSEALYIYDTTTMKLQNTIHTAHNPKGLAALSPTHTSCYLLYPSSEEIGNLQIYDCFTMNSRREIEAHHSPLTCIAISYQGHLAATASVKGTVLRVFALPEGTKLFTFKRGFGQALTYNLSFSMDGELLMSCSDTGTVHVYNLTKQVSPDETWTARIRTSICSAAGYIVPESYKDTFETNRSYIVAKTNFLNFFISTLVPGTNLILAVSTSGKFLFFQVDLQRGGEAFVIQEGNLLRLPSTMIKIS